MNDRELLESAAQSAAYGLTWSNDGSMCWLNECYDGRQNTDDPWNPLADDGDAFRLAMKLDIKMHHGYTRNKVGPAAFAGDGEQFIIEFHEDHVEGKCGAMRRAITRYAAEIGKVN